MPPKKRHITDSIIPRKKSKNQKKGSKAGQAFVACLALIILLPSVFVTLNETFGFSESIPGWSGIFSYFGLSGNSASPAVSAADGEVNVHFIDVGQGDCEFIQTPEFNILIDSGEREYCQSVINYLKNLGVNRLDYVIVTHPHSDHAGGMSYIISSIKTEKVIMPEIQESMIPTTGTYERLIETLVMQDCEVMYAKVGDKIELDAGAYMELLAPVSDYGDLNNYSIVMKLTHGKNSFLFTGDIEKEAEGDILETDADLSAAVLKVPHHGSSTSSTKKFLNAVGGKYAVIEVGSPNTYNHPNDKVVERLEALGYEIYRTDRHGSIIFNSDGNKLTVYVEKEYTDSISKEAA